MGVTTKYGERGEAHPSSVSVQDGAAFWHCEREALTCSPKGSCAPAKPHAKTQASTATGFWQLKIRHLVGGTVKQGESPSLLLIMSVFIEYAEPSLLRQALYFIFSGNFACTTEDNYMQQTQVQPCPGVAVLPESPPVRRLRGGGSPTPRHPEGLQGPHTGAPGEEKNCPCLGQPAVN